MLVEPEFKQTAMAEKPWWMLSALSFTKGKVTSLIGPNGAGKSTVMSIISRLIAKDEGLVEVEGKSIEKWKSKELSKHLAILTQSNHIQMKLTVRELVAFGRFPHSGGTRDRGRPRNRRSGSCLYGTEGV